MRDQQVWKIERQKCPWGDIAVITRMCGHVAGWSSIEDASLNFSLIPCGTCIEEKRQCRIKAAKPPKKTKARKK